MTENLEMVGAEKELKPLESEVTLLEEQANSIVITSDEDYTKAGDFAGKVNEQSKKIEKTRKLLVDPLNHHVKSINGMFNPQIDKADSIVKIIKNKMAIYYNKKEADRLKEEARLQAIRDKANEKREEKGQEMIAEPVREVAEVKKTAVGDFGKSTAKQVWTHKIISIDALPDDIKKAIFAEAYNKGIIKTVIQKFVNAGMRKIDGVEIYQETSIALGR